MNIRKSMAALLATGVLLAGATAAAADEANPPSSSSGSSSPSAGCENGSWPSAAEGAPANFGAGSPAGVYVWHDADGWHLRVTHPGTDRVVFSGRVAANRKIADHKVSDERNDRVSLNRAHDTLRLRLQNFGKVDGVDFHTACASMLRMTFSAAARDAAGKVRERQLSADQVFLGAQGSHPTSVPFALERSH